MWWTAHLLWWKWKEFSFFLDNVNSASSRLIRMKKIRIPGQFKSYGNQTPMSHVLICLLNSKEFYYILFVEISFSSPPVCDLKTIDKENQEAWLQRTPTRSYGARGRISPERSDGSRDMETSVIIPSTFAKNRRKCTKFHQKSIYCLDSTTERIYKDSYKRTRDSSESVHQTDNNRTAQSKNKSGFFPNHNWGSRSQKAKL